MKIALVACAMLMVGSVLADGPSARRLFNETAEQKAGRMAWWREARFGMFIHFGLYAIPARGEWVKSREQISEADYDRYFSLFDPNLFDARAWARSAKAAGMKYIVLTAKHHEGFCLWDTATTDYKITKTPFGRDLFREYVDACRSEGLHVGLYYSIIDWHHPDFTIDATHPQRPFRDLVQDVNDENVGSYSNRIAALNAARDMARYRAYMFEQVRELLTNYGTIDIAWFDYVNKDAFGKSCRDYDSEGLLRMIRKLQPQIIVNSRLDLMDTEDGWDFVCPEQFKPQIHPTVRGERVPWEVCQTFSGSWGYHRDEPTWKSVPQLVELLAETVSKDGNLILNVGPTARGTFDGRALARLDGFADWMRVNAESIYGCGIAPDGFVAPSGTCLTYNAAKEVLYIHLCDYPMGFLPLNFWQKIRFAQFLHDGSEIRVRPSRTSWNGQAGDRPVDFGGLDLPVVKPAVENPVVKVFLGRVAK